MASKTQQIIEYVKANPGETASTIARMLKFNETNTSSVLKKACDAGQLRREFDEGFFAGKKVYKYYGK